MNKLIISFLLVMTALPVNLKAQGLPNSPTEINSPLYGRLRVSRIYWVNLWTKDSLNTKWYTIDNKIVDALLYNEVKEANKKADNSNCKPCFLEVYDVSKRLIRKSISYTDCPVGKEITYFSSGKIKSIGYWRDNLKSTWQDFKCGMTGDWLYYNEDGKIVKVECHENDK